METDVSLLSQNVQEKCSNLDVLSRPDGSVIFSQGKTTILAGCYGPVEAKTNKVLVDKANIEIYFRPKGGIPSITDRLYEDIIKNICETALLTSLYPRTSVIIVLQEMQNFGGLISCAVNATCLALLDAAIDMKFLIAAVSCVVDADGKVILEAPPSEWEKAKAAFVFVFESTEGKIVASHTTGGGFTTSQFKEAIDTCKIASQATFGYFRDRIKQKISKSTNTRDREL